MQHIRMYVLCRFPVRLGKMSFLFNFLIWLMLLGRIL